MRDRISAIWRNAEAALNALWAWAKQPRKPEKRAERWNALAKWADHKAKQNTGAKRRQWQERADVYRRRAQANKPSPSPGVPGVVDGWHPGATKAQVSGGIGAFLSVPAKLVWHTTEGFGLPVYSGSAPHFTLDPPSGKLYQHVPIYSGAMALQNLSGGVETNRAHAIQVELIGFASQTGGWSDAAYANLAKLARWIEAHAGVERKCSVSFSNTPHRLGGDGWLNYAGHCGHQHVPENSHWDPGSLAIAKVLDQ